MTDGPLTPPPLIHLQRLGRLERCGRGCKRRRELSYFVALHRRSSATAASRALKANSAARFRQPSYLDFVQLRKRNRRICTAKEGGSGVFACLPRIPRHAKKQSCLLGPESPLFGVFGHVVYLSGRCEAHVES